MVVWAHMNGPHNICHCTAKRQNIQPLPNSHDCTCCRRKPYMRQVLPAGSKKPQTRYVGPQSTDMESKSMPKYIIYEYVDPLSLAFFESPGSRGMANPVWLVASHAVAACQGASGQTLRVRLSKSRGIRAQIAYLEWLA